MLLKIKTAIVLLFVIIATSNSNALLNAFLNAFHVSTSTFAFAPRYESGIPIVPLKLKNNRKEGRPITIGLQVGHWKTKELPLELSDLRRSTGAFSAGKQEWEAVYRIALETARILRKEHVVVDILPATVPKAYKADIFIAVHADQSRNPQRSGYKATQPWYDRRFASSHLVHCLELEYLKATHQVYDDDITRNMRYYYAFNGERFEHAIDPSSFAVIVETGFLSNERDRDLLINYPYIPARGLANGIIRFLNS